MRHGVEQRTPRPRPAFRRASELHEQIAAFNFCKTFGMVHNAEEVNSAFVPESAR